ncbi:MAG: hypothetical protein HOP20_10455 [Sulfuriferula sp.]|nr:hypothetical protein [Sulfuriferula sp.]
MEEEMFKTLTSFIVRSRKIYPNINSERLLSDVSYSAEVFAVIDAQGDEELVMCALKLRGYLGRLNAATVAEKEETKPAAPEKSKYTFGARG